MILLGVGIYFVWDTTLPFFETAHFWLGVEPVIGATNGTMWEWYFRTSLDHWSTFLGMLFALNYPVLSRWFLEVENMKVRECLERSEATRWLQYLGESECALLKTL